MQHVYCSLTLTPQKLTDEEIFSHKIQCTHTKEVDTFKKST